MRAGSETPGTLNEPTFAIQGLQKEKRETGAKNVFEEIIAESSQI